ncbi:unnamed protein product, partial [Chrysoparadoxa australica]
HTHVQLNLPYLTMKSACVCALSLAGASAFVPSTPLLSVSKASGMKMSSVDGMVGGSVELVKDAGVWDPLGLSELHKGNDDNMAWAAPHPDFLREAELKHGRIAMMATVGVYCCKAGIHFPGLDYTSTDWTTAFGEFATKNPFGLAQVVFGIAITEGYNYPEGQWEGTGDRKPGDWGFNYGGLIKTTKDEAKFDKLRLQELKNGRLAMIAMAAFASEHWWPG